MGKGTKNGVFIKNAEAMEVMDQVYTLIVDKTGTIAEGKRTVEKLAAFGTRFRESELIHLIASLNNSSEHPLAEATVKFGKEKDVEISKTEKFNSVSGKGVERRVDGKKLSLGNARMMEYIGAVISTEMEREASSFQQHVKTCPLYTSDAASDRQCVDRGGCCIVRRKT